MLLTKGYKFYRISLSCAVESLLLHVYVSFNLQPHVIHPSRWLHKKYVLYTDFLFFGWHASSRAAVSMVKVFF